MGRDRALTQEAVEVEALSDVEGQALHGSRISHAGQRRQAQGADDPDNDRAAQYRFAIHGERTSSRKMSSEDNGMARLTSIPCCISIRPVSTRLAAAPRS